MMLTDRFYEYKERIQTLRSAVENHFDKVMKEISEGLPSVIEDARDDSNNYNYG